MSAHAHNDIFSKVCAQSVLQRSLSSDPSIRASCSADLKDSLSALQELCQTYSVMLHPNDQSSKKLDIKPPSTHRDINDEQPELIEGHQPAPVNPVWKVCENITIEIIALLRKSKTQPANPACIVFGDHQRDFGPFFTTKDWLILHRGLMSRFRRIYNRSNRALLHLPQHVQEVLEGFVDVCRYPNDEERESLSLVLRIPRVMIDHFFKERETDMKPIALAEECILAKHRPARVRQAHLHGLMGSELDVHARQESKYSA